MLNVVTNAEVREIRRNGSGWRVITEAGDYPCGYVVSCAGLHSDRIAAMTGHARSVRILPFRGEYWLIRPERQELCRNLIYPVPNPEFPFLGVHFTRMIHGGVEAGPNAVLAASREGYEKGDFRLNDLADALAFPGLWRFLARYPKISWDELRRSWSKDLFCATLQRLVPEIQPQDLIEGGSGVRAMAMTADGGFVEDFHMIQGPNELHVVNAPSPGRNSIARDRGRDCPDGSWRLVGYQTELCGRDFSRVFNRMNDQRDLSRVHRISQLISETGYRARLLYTRLQARFRRLKIQFSVKSGGERGIRTPGSALRHYDGL